MLKISYVSLYHFPQTDILYPDQVCFVGVQLCWGVFYRILYGKIFKILLLKIFEMLPWNRPDPQILSHSFSYTWHLKSMVSVETYLQMYIFEFEICFRLRIPLLQMFSLIKSINFIWYTKKDYNKVGLLAFQFMVILFQYGV